MQKQTEKQYPDIIEFLKMSGGFAMFLSEEEPKVPATKEECENVFQELEHSLSPENLHCDGEISQSEAMNKFHFYNKVWKQVEEIAGYEREQLV